ncbi:hypothetical protein [Nocardia xishanensis]|uniref:Uncharacterized protein n=1 Tax=Nocardia xishanensis TaxID=238964 RepID=A0ABW7XBX9_9NOCA
MNEAQARILLCGELPALRDLARAGGWSAELSNALQALNNGGTALEVLAQLDPDLAQDSGDRGPTPHLLPGIDNSPLTGDYACPDDWCDRRAGRNADRTPPQCALRQRPMRFTSSRG